MDYMDFSNDINNYQVKNGVDGSQHLSYGGETKLTQKNSPVNSGQSDLYQDHHKVGYVKPGTISKEHYVYEGNEQVAIIKKSAIGTDYLVSKNGTVLAKTTVSGNIQVMKNLNDPLAHASDISLEAFKIHTSILKVYKLNGHYPST